MKQASILWEQGTPESVGIDSSAITKLVEAFEQNPKAELQGLMIMRHDKLVASGWAAPYREKDKGLVYSVSKSFTSTAIGLAVAEGLLSLDDQVISFFPEYLPAKISDNLAAMKIRHLLTMTTGHDGDTLSLLVGHRQPENNWISIFFNTPVDHQPGTHFYYNSGASYMLAAILQKASGQGMIDYLTPRLFEPLGISGVTWEKSEQGVVAGGWGLSVSMTDMMKLGLLYLHHGVYEGKRILSEEWIAEASSAVIDNHNWNPDAGVDWLKGYGYQFWRCKPGYYRADGAFGQYIIVADELDTVIAVKSESDDMQSELTAIWEILLPAIGRPLPENPDAYSEMEKKLAALVLAKAAGEGADREFSRELVLAENPFGIQEITCRIHDGLCTLELKVEEKVFSLAMGYQKYLETTVTQFPLFPNMLPSVAKPKHDTALACCYGFDGDWLTMRWQYLGSPHHLEITVELSEKVKITVLNSRNHEQYLLTEK